MADKEMKYKNYLNISKYQKFLNEKKAYESGNQIAA